MIAFLDANVLMQDLMCTGAVWEVLAHRPPSWALRLVTSEVAVAEVVAGYERQVGDALDALDRLTRSWGRIGARGEVDAPRRALEQKMDTYRSHLTASLAAAQVEVLPAPTVPHMDVVGRAVARRRPCDKAGDGYRDTLIWLTVVQVAADNPEEQALLTLVWAG